MAKFTSSLRKLDALKHFWITFHTFPGTWCLAYIQLGFTKGWQCTNMSAPDGYSAWLLGNSSVLGSFILCRYIFPLYIRVIKLSTHISWTVGMSLLDSTKNGRLSWWHRCIHERDQQKKGVALLLPIYYHHDFTIQYIWATTHTFNQLMGLYQTWTAFSQPHTCIPITSLVT